MGSDSARKLCLGEASATRREEVGESVPGVRFNRLLVGTSCPPGSTDSGGGGRVSDSVPEIGHNLCLEETSTEVASPPGSNFSGGGGLGGESLPEVRFRGLAAGLLWSLVLSTEGTSCPPGSTNSGGGGGDSDSVPETRLVLCLETPSGRVAIPLEPSVSGGIGRDEEALTGAGLHVDFIELDFGGGSSFFPHSSSKQITTGEPELATGETERLLVWTDRPEGAVVLHGNR